MEYYTRRRSAVCVDDTLVGSRPDAPSSKENGIQAPSSVLSDNNRASRLVEGATLSVQVMPIALGDRLDGITVTARNSATNMEYTGITSKDGYVWLKVPNGEYQLTAKGKGYSENQQSRIRLA